MEPPENASGSLNPTPIGIGGPNPESDPAFPSSSSDIPVRYRTKSVLITEITEDTKKVIPEADAVALADDLAITWHTETPDDLLYRLHSSATSGLSQDAVTRRLAEDGPNTLAAPKQNALLHYMSFLFSGFCPLLWVAAIMFFICWKPLGDPDPQPINLAISILVIIIIFLQAIFNAHQEHSSNKVMSTIFKMMPSFAQVLRGGVVVDVPTAQLVVGDIVDINIGDKVPADIRLLEVDQMKVDKSMLTGESEPISCTTQFTDKNYLETANLVFLGSNVVEGNGRGVVVATGNRTTMGKITSLASADQGTSKLQKQITYFVSIIAVLSICTGILCIAVWAGWLRKEYPNFMTTSIIVSTSLSAIVAYVPEGLPVCVTLTLTIVAKHMYKNYALVKSLPTIETLGSVDIIASDKTGTLTQNKMSVVNVFGGGKLVDIYDAKGLVNKDSLWMYETKDPVFSSLVDIAALCNRGFWSAETINEPLKDRKVVGDASDSALLIFAETYTRIENLRALAPKIAEIPFNSKNKWALSVHECNADIENFTVLIKGAAEQVLDRCSTILDAEGNIIELNGGLRKEILIQQEQLCDLGQRVLALCRMQIPKAAYKIVPGCDLTQVGLPMENFCFVGMAGLIDPPRPEVKGAVAACRKAGISVAMVTGDHPGTAAAIARMVGIITYNGPAANIANAPRDFKEDKIKMEEGSISVELQEFDKPVIVRGTDLPADQSTWDWVLSHKEIVFARTTPEQKLRIVKECQRRGKIVGVTGDGVNDAPALKQADIGIAMGAGSDVAREAADIILTDNKFSTVVVGIEHGRLVSENLKKVILYLLPAGTWSELTPVLATVFLGLPVPLSSFQMIYICILTDVFPSLSLIYEKSENDLMSRPPKARHERLVDWKLLVHAYAVIGNLESFFAFLSFFVYMARFGNLHPSDLFFTYDKWADGLHGKSLHDLNELLFTGQSVYFVTLVIMQYGNLHSIRTRHLSWFQQNPFHKKTRNLYLFGAMFISLILLIIAIYVPIFNDLFYTRAIPVEFWFLPFAYAFALFILDEVRKYFIRKNHSCFLAKIAW